MFAKKCLWFVFVGFVYFIIGQLLLSGDLGYFTLSIVAGVAVTLYLPVAYKRSFSAGV